MTYAALQGLLGGQSAEDAWEQAKQQLPGTASTLDKGCPRSAFVSLANYGFIVGVPARSGARPLSLNARHCLEAWKVAQADPTLLGSKREWWAATRIVSGTDRKSTAGILDVLKAFMVTGSLADTQSV